MLRRTELDPLPLERGPGAPLGANGARRLGSLPACRTIAVVAYDEELAGRIRELVGSESDLTEKKMFGGLAFLIGGNMAVAASGQGGILVRVDPAESNRLVATTKARLMEMGGRRMRGWLRVDAADLRTKRQLVRWVELGTTYSTLLRTDRRRRRTALP
jgi:TfoX/Sxy family transcriptional regulator of competence genes